MSDAPLWMALGAALNGAFLAWLWKPWRVQYAARHAAWTAEPQHLWMPDSDCSVGCFVCGWRADVPQTFISAAVKVHADTCPGMERP